MAHRKALQRGAEVNMQRVKMKSMIFGTIVLMALAGAAQASVIGLTNTAVGAPTLGLSDTGSIPLTAIGAGTNDWYFNYSGAVSVLAATAGFGVTGFGLELLDSANAVQGTGVLSGPFANLSAVLPGPGTYHLHFNGSGPGSYFGSVGFLAPVPLPAAAWLMLSGLAGLGAFARRRRDESLAA
jgi:hypothetical protein